MSIDTELIVSEAETNLYLYGWNSLISATTSRNTSFIRYDLSVVTTSLLDFFLFTELNKLRQSHLEKTQILTSFCHFPFGIWGILERILKGKKENFKRKTKIKKLIFIVL